MSFGIAVIPRWSARESHSLFHTAEELGFDTVWVPDQTFFNDPFPLLGALALTTRRVRIGVGVTNPFTRNPAQLARAAVALDSLSGGRFILGMGAGNRKELIEKLGMSQDKITSRTREAVGILRALIRGERVTREGGFFTLKGVALESPVNPDIPIYLAARAPRMLELARDFAVTEFSFHFDAPCGECLGRHPQGSPAASRYPEPSGSVAAQG